MSSIHNEFIKYDKQKYLCQNLFSISVKTICALMCVFHLYTSVMGVFPALVHRPIHIAFAFLLLFLLYPAKESRMVIKRQVPWYDLLACIAILSICLYYIFNQDYIMNRLWYVTPITIGQYIVSAILIILVIEAGRRTIGFVFMVIVLCFIAYAFLGPSLPGFIAHRGIALNKFIDTMILTPEGIFGIATGVSATYILIFILFGSFLGESKAGQFFIDVAMSLAGHARGGPAKVAVLSSASVGTISGSVVANVVTTGTFTIPMMKKLGYKKEFAAAVEAVASTGGMIMPPIMGATAFVVAELTNIPYIQICKHAALPAILYFLSVIFMVDLEAKKIGLKGLSVSELPNLFHVLKGGWYLLTPLAIVVVLLIEGFTPLTSGFYAIVATFLVSWIRTDTRIDFKKLLKTFEDGAKNAVQVAAACACAGIIIGIVSQTGLGFRMTGVIIALSGGYLPVALVLSMIVALILGMGLTVTPAYIIQAALICPVLINMGLLPIQAHLFAFYFSCLCAITPPVAIGAFAAAGIANADNMKTGWTAVRLGIAAYMVPFIFAYGPGLLLIGDVTSIIIASVTAIIGVYALSAGAEGIFLTRTTLPERLLLLLAALLLIKPGIFTDLAGLACIALVFILQKFGKRN